MQKPKDVATYIANAASEARPVLTELRELIRATLPAAEERISWGVPFYFYHGEIGGFAAYKNHVSFGFGTDVLQPADRTALEEQGYKTAKGTLQIRFDQPMPAAIIRRVLTAKAAMHKAVQQDNSSQQ